MRLALFITLIFLTGCAYKPVVEEKNEQLSTAVYAAYDASEVGRFDLSTIYLSESIRLIAPPEKRVKISPFVVNE